MPQGGRSHGQRHHVEDNRNRRHRIDDRKRPDVFAGNGLLPGACVPEIAPEALDELLADTSRLSSLLNEKLRKFSRNSGYSTSQGIKLGINDMQPLISALAKELTISEEIFGDMKQKFWRFDFSGDGLLDVNEILQLCVSVLRAYRDSISPPKPGIVKLGGQIPQRQLDSKYNVSKKLGQGGQGAVYLAEDRISRQTVVVKFYDKSCRNAPVEAITREFELMMKLKHPKIAHYFDIFQDHANIYVVSEPYFGGDLNGAVAKASKAGARVDEVWQSNVMKQVVQGIQFLHSNEIMHCDLKEANVMIARDENWQDPEVVVIDFGLSNSFAANKTRASGTPGYMPPEVFENGLWTPRGDVFSIGVMLYRMRVGKGPFSSGVKDAREVRRNTIEKEIVMEVGSTHLRKLVHGCLTKKLSARPSLRAVSQHPWLVGNPSASVVCEVFEDDVIQALEKQRSANELQRALLADFASRQNLADLRDLNRLFMELDTDLSGYLTLDEVRATSSAMDRDALNSLLAIVEAFGGSLSYEEFMGQLIASKEPEENRILSQIFEEFDRNMKGYLVLNDIEDLLKRPVIAGILGKRSAANVMQAMDKDGNGKIQFNEFRMAMQGSSSAPTLNFQELRKGQSLQYYSPSNDRWISCTIVEVDRRAGAVQVDVKIGYWIAGAQINERLRLLA